jgi:hypothetical protein
MPDRTPIIGTIWMIPVRVKAVVMETTVIIGRTRIRSVRRTDNHIAINVYISAIVDIDIVSVVVVDIGSVA